MRIVGIVKRLSVINQLVQFNCLSIRSMVRSKESYGETRRDIIRERERGRYFVSLYYVIDRDEEK